MPPRPSPGARTPLFGALRRAWRIAASSRLPGAPPVDELVAAERESRRARKRAPRAVGAAAVVDRRAFLKAAGVGAAGLALGPSVWGCTPDRLTPGTGRVAIVGAGMAGLNAAFHLRHLGIHADLYEASDRTGGRMYTARDLVAPGTTTELGGEFIDSTHADLLGLVSTFGLELVDRQDPSEEALAEGYYFGGRHYTEEEVVEAFVPLAARIQSDYDSTGEVVDFENEGGASDLDHLSLAEYLDRIGATGFIRELLDVAYVTEYGLDAGEQSALNLVFLIGTDTEDGFAPFGDSDERFKVLGGNQRVVDELAARLADRIRTGHRLVALRRRGTGFALTFDVGGATRDVEADAVVLTLPFTLLRQVDLTDLGLPDFKRRAIDELGYGTNAKLFAGMTGRPWRAVGYEGACFSDAGFQLCWDHAQLQPTEAAGLTLYSGGAAGLAVGTGSPEDQVARLLPGADAAFPGVAAAYNGRAARFHWPTHPFTLASYACYRPGQWTTIAGAEIRNVGRLFFAGEHCSYEFQGYMNGAAETGRRTARAVARALGVNTGAEIDTGHLRLRETAPTAVAA